MEEGVSSKVVKILQSMYLSVKSCVRVNGSLSDFLTVIWVLNKGNLYPMCYFVFRKWYVQLSQQWRHRFFHIQRIHDQYHQSCLSKLEMFNTLCTYKLFELEFTFEAYLSCVSNIKHRNSLSRFRSSAHLRLWKPEIVVCRILIYNCVFFQYCIFINIFSFKSKDHCINRLLYYYM